MNRWLTIVLMMVIGWSLAGGLQVQPTPTVIVDPQVWEDTANGATGSFLVVLRQQEDAAALAQGAQDWLDQGNRVYDGLKAAAESSQRSLKAALDDMGVPYRAFWIINMLAVDGTRQVVETLSKRSDVQRIENNRSFTVPLELVETGPNLEVPAAVDWNITRVRAPEVWAAGYNGQGSVVANADTGVNWQHPGLKPHYRGWNGVTADHNYNWWDAIHNDIGGGGNPCGFNTTAPCDDHGHGTHTTGTQVGDDGSRTVGVAPGAKWIACRNMEGGVGRPETYIECLQFFIAPTDLAGQNADPSKRPDSVGNSYGCPTDELCTATSLHTAIETVRAAGIFMAVSAGNDGSSCSSVDTPPALEAGVFTVGATTNTDTISSFSSRGPVTVDGSNRRKPDITAPGSGITSTLINGGYGSMSGTSMASPHVSGAVALLVSAVPALRGNVGFLETALATYAVPIYTNQGCGGDTPTTRPNNTYGWGLLDVKATFDYLVTLVFPPSQLSTQVVSDSQINLVWQDNSGQEDGFKIERKVVGEILWSETGTVGMNVTAYQDSGLTCQTSYSYRVRTYRGETISDPSNTSTATTGVCLNAPENLAAVGLDEASILLEWTDVTDGEDGFKLERSLSGSGSWAEISSLPANSTNTTDSGLACTGEYYYRLRAYVGGNNSSYSNVATGACLPPIAPDGLVAINSLGGKIDLSWVDRSSNETGYQVERSANGGDWTEVALLGANITTYSDIGLPLGEIFYYRVRAGRGIAYSAYSESALSISGYPLFLPVVEQ